MPYDLTHINIYIVIHVGIAMESPDIGNRVGIDVRQGIERSFRRLHQNPYRIFYHFLSHLRNGKFGQDHTKVLIWVPT